MTPALAEEAEAAVKTAAARPNRAALLPSMAELLVVSRTLTCCALITGSFWFWTDATDSFGLNSDEDPTTPEMT